MGYQQGTLDITPTPQGLVKQDNNFLRHPLWFMNHSQTGEAGPLPTLVDRNGFIYKANYRVPAALDFLVLLALLKKSQMNGFATQLEFTGHELLTECGMDTSKHGYARLKEVFETWMGVQVEFSGTFFDGKSYRSMMFHIVESVHEYENKKRIVTLSKQWVDYQRHSKWFSYIDFSLYRALKSPLARRLYERLLVAFNSSDRWDIPYFELAAELDIKPKKDTKGNDTYHRSEILRLVEKAVENMNSLCCDPEKMAEFGIQTPIVATLHTGKTIFAFTRKSTPPAVLQDHKIGELLPLAKHPLSSGAKRIIQTHLKEKGAEYIAGCIEYANATNKDASKYSYYLGKVIENDWAHDHIAAEASRLASKAPTSRPTTEGKVEEKRDIEAELRMAALDALDKETYQELELVARAALEESGIDPAFMVRPIVRSAMAKILAGDAP